MEYLPTFARTKSPSFVGEYTSTMEHMGLASTDKSLKLKVHDKDINKILGRSHRLPHVCTKKCMAICEQL